MSTAICPMCSKPTPAVMFVRPVHGEVTAIRVYLAPCATCATAIVTAWARWTRDRQLASDQSAPNALQQLDEDRLR